MVGTPRPSRSQSSRPRSTPSLPAMAIRWITALVEPPMAPLTRMAFSKARRVRIWDMRMSWRTSSTMRRPAIWASTPRRESTAGMAALSGMPMPSASTMLAMVEAVPMVMQLPAERLCPCSAAMKSSTVMLARLHFLEDAPDMGPRADGLAAEIAVQHRPAGDGDGRQIAARRPHQQRRRGLVAAHQQDHPVDRDCRGSIPPHPCWRDCGTAWPSGRRLDSPSDITGNSRGKPPAS